MSDKRRKVLTTFAEMLPHLPDVEVEKLLAFAEGMAFMADRQQEAVKA